MKWIKTQNGNLVNTAKVFSIELSENTVIVYNGEIINNGDDIYYNEVVLGTFKYPKRVMDDLAEWLVAKDDEKVNGLFDCKIYSKCKAK